MLIYVNAFELIKFLRELTLEPPRSQYMWARLPHKTQICGLLLYLLRRQRNTEISEEPRPCAKPQSELSSHSDSESTAPYIRNKGALNNDDDSQDKGTSFRSWTATTAANANGDASYGADFRARRHW